MVHVRCLISYEVNQKSVPGTFGSLHMINLTYTYTHTHTYYIRTFVFLARRIGTDTQQWNSKKNFK